MTAIRFILIWFGLITYFRKCDCTCNEDGKFGLGCRFTCHCKDGEICDKDTGHCRNGCSENYWGSGCQLDLTCYYDLYGQYYLTQQISCSRGGVCNPVKCPQYPNCAYDDTDRINYPHDLSQCDHYLCAKKCDCPLYRYSSGANNATNCDKECGMCAGGADCSKYNGLCPHGGCAAGWTGQRCETPIPVPSECAYNQYKSGVQCVPCGHCSSGPCDNSTGRCSGGCQTGYTGDKCKDPCSKPSQIEPSFTSESASIRLTWTQPWTPNNCPITEYKIDYRLYQQGLSLDCPRNSQTDLETVTTTETSYTITALSYSQYYIRFTVTSDSGDSEGFQKYFDTKEAKPGMPTDVKTDNVDENRILVYWSKPKCKNRNGLIKNYLLQVKKVRGGCSQDTFDQTYNLTPTLKSVDNLKPGTNYSFQVEAQTSAGVGRPSKVVYATTKEKALPAVSNLNLIYDDANRRITIQWSQVNDEFCQLRSYKWRFEERSLACRTVIRTTNWLPTSRSTTSAVITDTKPYHKYTVQVVAIGNTLEGAVETKEFITPEKEPEPTCAPSNVRDYGTTKRAESVRIAWDELDCNCRNGEVKYKYSAVPENSKCALESKRGTFNDIRKCSSLSCDYIHGLVPFTRYKVKIQGFTSAGDGPWSTDAVITTAQVTKPGKVDASEIRRASNVSSINLNWMPPCPPRASITGYNIQYKQQNESWPGHTNEESCYSCPPYIMKNGLRPSTIYNIRIGAVSEYNGRQNYGEFSDEIIVKTEEGIPDPPSRVALTKNETKALEIYWTEPKNSNGVLTNYKITCTLLKTSKAYPSTADKRTRVSNVSHDTRMTRIDGLLPASLYNVTVYAKTFAYGEGLSEQFWTALPEPGQLPPVSVKREYVTDTTVALTLQPVEYDGPISYYRIVLEETENTGDTAQFDIARLSDYNTTKKTQGQVMRYITLQINGKETLEDQYVIGDGKMHGVYYNAPLQTGKTYKIYYGFVSILNSDSKSAYTGIEVEGFGRDGFTFQALKYKPEASSSVGLVVGVVVGVVFFIILVVAAVLLFLRYRNRQKKEADQNGLAMNPVPRRAGARKAVENHGRKPELDPLLKNKKTSYSYPVKIADLLDYVTANKVSDDGLRVQYTSIPDGSDAPWTVAKKVENKNKNRYGNIVAYDHNRVILSIQNSDPHSDYINASYLDGYKEENTFIATQGPTPRTINDFWRMIWEHDIPSIVMVTNCLEDGRRKCEQYWPDGDQDYGKIKVTLCEKEDLAECTIRRFSLQKVGHSGIKETTQFHFTAWPDHGVPMYATHLLQFHRRVSSHQKMKPGPVLVHCSAGVGRTGTFILLDILLKQAKAERQVDVPGYLHRMRQQRVNMIQTPEQYTFVFDAILEHVLCGDTFIPTDRFMREYDKLSRVNVESRKSGLQSQFDTLQKVSTSLLPNQCHDARLAENASKNRFPDILPGEVGRPYLSHSVDGGDYINAVYADGYKVRNGFIATQIPMPSTVVDFWRLMWDHGSDCLVLLEDIDPTDETCVQYWPELNSRVSYDVFSVECTAETNMSMGQITSRTLMLTKNVTNSNWQKSNPPRRICQFKVNGWPKDKLVHPKTYILLELLSAVERWQQSSGNTAITVMCLDGQTRCGVFIGASCVVDKIKVEQGVDVFQVVKSIRSNRPGFITNEEQYDFLYNVAKNYIESFETYANFK